MGTMTLQHDSLTVHEQQALRVCSLSPCNRTAKFRRFSIDSPFLGGEWVIVGAIFVQGGIRCERMRFPTPPRNITLQTQRGVGLPDRGGVPQCGN